MPDKSDAPQLFLVTPVLWTEAFASTLADALSGGPVGAVLIAGGATEPEREVAAARLVPIIQAAGVAALVADHTRVAGRSRADGIQIESGLGDLRAAVSTFRPGKILGAGGIGTRHTAMEAGEAEPDYLFFGKPHGDTHPEPHPKALDLAQWWSELTQIPAVVMAGSALGSLGQARETGAAFVALHRAVWEHPGGPAEAVRLAAAALAEPSVRAA